MTMRFVSKITLTLAGILVVAGGAPLSALATQAGSGSQNTQQTEGTQGTTPNPGTQGTTDPGTQSPTQPEGTQPEGTEGTQQTEQTPSSPQTEQTPSTTQTESTPSTTQTEQTPSTTQTEQTPSTTQTEGTQGTTQNPSTQGTTQTNSTQGTTSTEGTQGTRQGEGTQGTTQGTMQGDAATQPRGAMNGPDRKFVMEAARGGMAEVEMGRLATERGASDEVKQFGQRMVDDHSKANTELSELATNMRFEAPKELGPEMAKMRDQLSQLSGADFDREYMRMMVEDHEKDVKMFERQATKGNAGSVKDFAAKTLPTLQEHLKMAKDINKRTKKGGGNAAGQTQSGQTQSGQQTQGGQTP